MSSATVNAMSATVGRSALAQVARRADDVVVDEGEQADVTVAVDVGERVEHLRRQLGGHAGEEALVARAGGEPGEEVGERATGPHGVWGRRTTAVPSRRVLGSIRAGSRSERPRAMGETPRRPGVFLRVR